MLVIVLKDMMFMNSINKHFDKNNIIQKCQIKATPIVIGVVIRVVPVRARILKKASPVVSGPLPGKLQGSQYLAYSHTKTRGCVSFM